MCGIVYYCDTLISLKTESLGLALPTKYKQNTTFSTLKIKKTVNICPKACSIFFHTSILTLRYSVLGSASVSSKPDLLSESTCIEENMIVYSVSKLQYSTSKRLDPDKAAFALQS